MAIYRMIQMSFWTDTKVSDDFTPEEKLLYLYLLTNPHTNLCGCYEVSVRQMAMETGLTNDRVRKNLAALQNKHKTVVYDEETREVLLVNWHKYNWTRSEKFEKPLAREIETVKSEKFKDYLIGLLNDDTVSIPYPYRTDTDTNEGEYGTDTTVTVTDTVSDTVTDTVTDTEKYPISEIIDYLNAKAGTKFRDKSRDTRSHIRARYAEGFTTEDFFTVIDKKCAEWGGTDYAKFLRPATLFGSKFEGYLNQQAGKPKSRNDIVDTWV